MHAAKLQAVVGLVAILTVGIAAPTHASGQTADRVVLGPVHEVATLARFGADAPGAWTGACGQAVEFVLTPGRRVPGVPEPVLEAHVWRKDLTDREGSHTWFSLKRDDVPAVDLPDDVDGIRIVLGSLKEAQWWISPTLTTDKGETFSIVLDANPFPSRRLVQWTLPLAKFQNARHEPLTVAKLRTVRGISFATSSAGTSLLFDRITAYRHERSGGWLDFTTSHPTNNLFQRTDPLSIAFTVGGTPPEGATGFCFEVRDYYGRIIDRGTARFGAEPRHHFVASRHPPGYYEVTAHWTDAAGKDVQAWSCIRAEGSMADGLGTFAVLPHTIAENRARSKRLGERAFFGLHGDFLDLGDYVGLTWRFGYTAWQYLEPTKPDRSSGTASWAQAEIAKPPAPPYRFHIQPFILNSGGPQWANNSSASPPAYAWDDAMAMVRDAVKVEKHLYPHMAHRLYGGLWEVDLNNPIYGPQKPVYKPADIAEAYRRIREVVKAEDSAGMVIGPCSSVIRPEWFEDVFRAGVLQWVDGIETHAYCESTLTPEADDLPGRIHKLNALILKYHGGKPLPIYVTEAGQPGILGSDIVVRSQAERMVRQCIILKGEGVRVYLPFYGIDYDRTGYWGFLYNLDIDSPSGPWSTQRTSPKPMVNAVATCVDMLEGAEPIRRVVGLGDGVWAYSFRRGSETITAVWSPEGTRTASVPVRGLRVRVVDMMGRDVRFTSKGGALWVTAGEAPVYVVSSTR